MQAEMAELGSIIIARMTFKNFPVPTTENRELRTENSKLWHIKKD